MRGTETLDSVAGEVSDFFFKYAHIIPQCRIHPCSNRRSIPRCSRSTHAVTDSPDAESTELKIHGCSARARSPGAVNSLCPAHAPGDRELEMLVILRMNRDFMDFMRKNYAAEASKYMKQQFGCTVVKAESDQ